MHWVAGSARTPKDPVKTEDPSNLLSAVRHPSKEGRVGKGDKKSSKALDVKETLNRLRGRLYDRALSKLGR